MTDKVGFDLKFAPKKIGEIKFPKNISVPFVWNFSRFKNLLQESDDGHRASDYKKYRTRAIEGRS